MKIYIISQESDCGLYTSQEIFNILWGLISDLESDFESNDYSAYLNKIRIIKNKKNRALVIQAIQIIEKILVDCRRGVLLLQRGLTNEYLVNVLPILNNKATDIKERLIKLIAGCNNQNLKSIVSPLIISLDRFCILESGIFTNISELCKNVPLGDGLNINEPGSSGQISYKFNIAKLEGVLKMENFNQLIVTGRKSLAYYFLYKNKDKNEDYDYHDINIYLSKNGILAVYSSNQLRKDVEWLNDQVQDMVGVPDYEIIIKQTENLKNKAKRNRYKFIER